MSPTSERLFRLLLLGLKRTSLKSSLRSASTRGILDPQNLDDQDEDDEYAEGTPLRRAAAAAAVVVTGLKPQPPNPNLQAASVFIAKGGSAQLWPPWLYLGLSPTRLPLCIPPLLRPYICPPHPAEWQQQQWRAGTAVPFTDAHKHTH